MSTNKAVPWTNIWKTVGLSMVFGSALAFAACSPAASPTPQPSNAEPTATTAVEATATAEATATTASASETTTETTSAPPTEAMTATTETGSATATETVTATESMTTTESMTATETTTSTGASSSGMATTEQPTIMVYQDATLGNILVDGNGMTLYVFDKDTPGVSNCSGGCLTKWPPLTTSNEQTPVMAGDSVTATFGVITRDDGTYQVTVNDMPLYYYASDSAAGDVTGQAVGDVWWVVGPDGNKLMTQ